MILNKKNKIGSWHKYYIMHAENGKNDNKRIYFLLYDKVYIYLFKIQNQWSRFLSFVAETLCLSSCRMYEEIHGSELTTQARQKSQSKGRVGEEKGKLQLYSTLTLKTSRAKQCWSADFMQRVPVLKKMCKNCEIWHGACGVRILLPLL